MSILLSNQSQIEIKNHIANIIYEHGESFQKDDGIDTDVCDKTAEEILEFIKQILADISRET